MQTWIIGILFIILLVVAGIIQILFAHRMLKWWQRVGGSLTLKIAPWRKSPGKNIDDVMDEWAKSRWHIYDTVGIWLMRITGVAFIVFSALVLYLLISKL